VRLGRGRQRELAHQREEPARFVEAAQRVRNAVSLQQRERRLVVDPRCLLGLQVRVEQLQLRLAARRRVEPRQVVEPKRRLASAPSRQHKSRQRLGRRVILRPAAAARRVRGGVGEGGGRGDQLEQPRGVLVEQRTQPVDERARRLLQRAHARARRGVRAQLSLGEARQLRHGQRVLVRGVEDEVLLEPSDHCGGQVRLRRRVAAQRKGKARLERRQAALRACLLGDEAGKVHRLEREVRKGERLALGAGGEAQRLERRRRRAREPEQRR